MHDNNNGSNSSVFSVYQKRLVWTTIVAIPLSYVVNRRKESQQHKKRSSTVSGIVQHGSVLALWAAYLSILLIDAKPDANKDDDDMPVLPLRSQETMIFSVLVWIIPLKLMHVVLFDERNCLKDGVENGDLSSSKGQRISPLERMSDFATFVGSAFYYAFPISRVAKDRSTTAGRSTSWWQLLKPNVEYLVVICIKLVLLPVFDAAARRLVAANEEKYSWSRPHYWTLLALFYSTIVAGAWITDLQCVLVNVLSAGRYEMLPMHRYPLLSQSMGEFWSRRYNLLIHTLFKETVYVPVRVQMKAPKWVAVTAVFIMSGLLHSWVAYFTFGRTVAIVARAMLCFVIQIPWILVVEQRLPLYSSAKRPNQAEQGKGFDLAYIMLRILVTSTICFLTLSIYVGLFVDAYPEWLDMNDPNVPKLPILSNLSQHLADRLGLLDSTHNLRWY